ncbi:hypothetical protein HRbin17_01378 [bacterium HR17]|jgi:hypothetical protein|uniref:DUF4337 domain-containing protein n=1 Tax=Candidatus Fervidibacter japonicus TaxID=2035412 RepID=A0A2H5XCD5_9BACT|nr:hypothetical protein HRbin17_01378 [bacterium HR17]
MDEVLDELQEQVQEPPRDWLNRAIAMTLAIFAAIMTLAKIVDDNIVQEIIADNQQWVDAWLWYQASSVKEHLFELQVDQVRLWAERNGATAQWRARLNAYAHQSAKYRQRKAQTQRWAQQWRKRLEVLNAKDDWFDRGDALFGMSFSFLAVSALTRRKWLYGVAVLLGVTATAMAAYGWWLPVPPAPPMS